MRTYIYMILITAWLCGVSYAAEPKAILSIDKAGLAPGKQAKLTLKVFGEPSVKEPEIPFVNGLDIKYQSSGVKGEGSKIFIYRVVAKKTGEYKIGPVHIEYQDGRHVSSNEIIFTVSKEPYSTPAAVVPGDIGGDISKRIYLTVDLPKKTVYVNEKLPVEIKLFSDWFDLEDIIVNEIATGELLADKITKGGSSIVNIGDVRFAVLVYKTNITAPTPGNFIIEPVKVSLNIAPRRPDASGALPPLLNNNEVFYKDYTGGRNEMPLGLETEPVGLEVVPLPAEGRPATFKGAVGNFKFEAGISPDSIKIDQDVKIKLEVTGDGNYTTFNAINIPFIPGTRPHEPVIRRSPDAFTMEQVIRVISPDVNEIPAITFSYFDPNKGAYISLTKGPFPLKVESLAVPAVKPVDAGEERSKPKPAAVPAKDMRQKEVLVNIKSSMGRLSRFDPYIYSGPIALATQILPIFLVFAAVIIKNRMNFLESDHEYAAWLRMSKRSASDISRAEWLFKRRKTKEFYDHIFLFMQLYLGSRLMVPPEGITEKTVGEMLSEKVGDAVVLDKIKRIFADSYIARFTSVPLSEDDMHRTLDDLKEVIDYLNGRTYLLNI